MQHVEIVLISDIEGSWREQSLRPCKPRDLQRAGHRQDQELEGPGTGRGHKLDSGI